MNRVALALLLTASLAESACEAEPLPQPNSGAETFVSGRLMAPEKVADHIWVMRQPDRVWSAVIGNVVIIEQSDGIVLVDSGGTIEDGKDVLSALERLTPKPVRAVIVTHWHNDHPLGLPAITARYPGVRVIATKATAKDLADPEVITTGIGKVDEARRDARFKASEERSADYRRSAEDQRLTAEVRREYAIEAAWVMERARRQLGNFVVLPTETFTDRLSLDDTIAPVEALFLGRANTRGDAFVWLPKQKVMIAGDAVVAPTPYGFTNPIGPWLATFDRLEAFPFTTLVPGHGKVQRDRAYLATLRWSMMDIARQAKALAATEPDAETALRRFDPTEHRRRFGARDSWMLRWLNDYWLQGMFETAFDAATGAGKDDKVD